MQWFFYILISFYGKFDIHEFKNPRYLDDVFTEQTTKIGKHELKLFHSTLVLDKSSKWWKESMDSDAQQLNQYQQYEHSPLTSNHWP